MIQQPHFWVPVQKNGKQDPEEIFHTHVHCSVIENSQDAETI